MYGTGPDYAGLDVSSTHSSGARISDTAGVITTPNALAPGYRSWDTGGGINLSYDASRALNLDRNQQLWFGLTGDFRSDSANFAASALTPGGPNANAASTRSNMSTIVGSANYRVDSLYFSGVAAFDFSHVDVTNNFIVPGAQGSTDGRGYAVGATVGKLFSIFNTTGLNPASIVKAPPQTLGGSALYVDVSGHYLYRHEHEDAFSDSSGFAYGTGQLSYSDIGARARLLGVVPDRGFAWMPYVGATFDHTLGLRETLDIPAQGATPADTLIFSPANNFWGAELGLDIFSANSAKFGMKAFYQASADTRTTGGSAYIKIPLWDPDTVSADSGLRIAPRVGLPLKAPPATAPAFWNWAGLYIGGHVGGGLSTTQFFDPFGAPILGDRVRSPAFLGGGQIGYNWQAPNSHWVFGLEADASLMGSDGDNTCFAASSAIVNSTCRVRPQATGTFTGRVGYVFDPTGRTMIYGKGGLGWATEKVDMALNTFAVPILDAAAFALSNNQTVTLWGGTLGVGVERALTPAWSVKAEYDYVDLGHGHVANLGNLSIMPLPPFTIGAVAPGTSGVSQNIQEVKLGLNYKWGADPRAAAWDSGPVITRNVLPASGWEVEGGGRYFGSWGQFQKDFGLLKTSGLPNISDASRLTFSDMKTSSGEFFGRIDSPWNVFVKGYVGGGSTDSGHLNDEDNVITFGPVVAAYSATLSPAVTGTIKYGVIDGGFDFLRGPGYKIGAFAGYFALNQGMSAFGCVAIASVNCTPIPVPTSGSPAVTENDKWQATRVGLAAEAMLTSRVKISAEAAYLPWVRLNGTDQHFVGNTGVLAEIFPESGKGTGVQLEGALSYYVTREWSVGVGARYWGMWTTPNGQINCTFGCGATPTAPQLFRAQVEQLGGFVQTSYKFDFDGSAVATR